MAPNGTGIDNPSEWRARGDAGWRVEMLAKDEQIRVLTARLAAAEAALRTIAKAATGEWQMCPTDRCGAIRIICDQYLDPVTAKGGTDGRT